MKPVLRAKPIQSFFAVLLVGVVLSYFYGWNNTDWIAYLVVVILANQYGVLDTEETAPQTPKDTPWTEDDCGYCGGTGKNKIIFPR